MAWDSIIDQTRVVEILRNSLRRDRVAHAYLFHGPDGVGKRAVGLEFARALECPNQVDAPCEDCPTCRKTRRMMHPDIHVHMPYPSGASDDEAAERIQMLGKNPYAPVDFSRRPSLSDPSETSNKQVMYRKEHTEEKIMRPIRYHSGEGKYKVSIITDAEKMNTDSANVFLKLLEEPPPQTVFILTTPRPEQLLPTITSRCQKLRFDPLTPEAIESALKARTSMKDATAATFSRMADGSYSRALELSSNDDLMTSRSLVQNYFRAAYTRKVEPLTDHVNEISRLGRERVKSVLRLMLRWIRDLMLYRHLGDEAPLVNVDQAETIARFVDNLPDADLEGMVGLVEEAIVLTERNVKATLILMALAQTLSISMRGNAPKSLYVPLPELELNPLG